MNTMEAEDLLRRACRRATAKAKSLGYDIDVERNFVLVSYKDGWKINIFNPKGEVVFNDNCGIEILHYVLPDYKIIFAPGELNTFNYCSVMRLTRLDKFDTMILDPLFPKILEKMLSNGAYFQVKHRQYVEAKSMLDNISKSLLKWVDDYMHEHGLSIREIYMSPIYSQMKSKMQAQAAKWRQFTKPINIDIIPSNVNTVLTNCISGLT